MEHKHEMEAVDEVVRSLLVIMDIIKMEMFVKKRL
jgi:hypothetical protein